MKLKNKIYAVFVIISIFLAPCGVFAQQLQVESLDRIKNELLRFSNTAANAATGTTQVKAKQSTATEAEKEVTTSAITFPKPEEIITKSDVAHINPDTYVLGPGDKLNIAFYGLVSGNYPAVIQPDGTIFLSPAPPIYVQGLTIREAKSKIYRIMCGYYKEFNIDLQITSLRTFKINILGEVTNPGTFIITPTIGVCDAISLAGGLKAGASTRNIVLEDKRKKRKWRIDLFKWFYLGKKDENRMLDIDYSIYVPLRKEKISVEGAFKRTGVFEIVLGEKLSDIVSMMEPATEAVLEFANITRTTNENKLDIIPVNINKIMHDPDSKDNIPLTDGDIVFIPSVNLYVKKILVIGELEGANQFAKTQNPLTGSEEIIKISLYNLREGERVKDVISMLGGLTVKADLEKARIERPIGNGQVEYLPINLRKLMYDDDQSQNLALLPGDALVVPSIPSNVYVLGEISNPGAYQYNVGLGIKDYIAAAGGPTSRSRMRMAKVISSTNGKPIIYNFDLRSLLSGNQLEPVTLRPGDVIYIPYADIASWRDIIGAMTNLVVLRNFFIQNN